MKLIAFVFVFIPLLSTCLACNCKYKNKYKGVLFPLLFSTTSTTTTTSTSTTSTTTTTTTTSTTTTGGLNYGIVMLPPHGRLITIQDSYCYAHGHGQQLPAHLDPKTEDITDASEGTTWPWLAYIHTQGLSAFNRKTIARLTCLGTLISADTVVTAASCVPNPKLLERNRMSVLFAANQNDLGSEELIPVKSIKHHRLYNPNKKTNDLAMLKLSRMINFTSSIFPICMPTRENIWDEKINKYLSIGWPGAASYSSFKVVNTLSINNGDETCNKFTESNTKFCAYVKNSTKSLSTCSNEVGSPLIYKGLDKRWTLFGLASSFSTDKSDCLKPRFYTIISEYVEWLIENL